MACEVSQLSAEKYDHGTFMTEILFFNEGQEAFQATLPQNIIHYMCN